MDVYRRMAIEAQRQREETWSEYFQRRNAYIEAYTSPAGRMVLRDMLEQHYFFTSTIVGKPDALTYSREASRNVLLKIMDTIPGIVGEVIRDRCLEREQALREQSIKEESNG